MRSVSLGSQKLDRRSTTGTVVLKEEEQMQSGGEIVSEKGEFVCSLVANIVAIPENTHVAYRTSCSSGYEHIHSTRHDEDNGSKKLEGDIWHLIRYHHVWKHENTCNRYQQKQRTDCCHDSSKAVCTPYRAVQHGVECFLLGFLLF